MAKREMRYVYDSGGIYRMTEKQYRQYIFRNVNKSYTEGPTYFGTLVGVSSFNATRATKDDYEDEARRLRAEEEKRGTRYVYDSGEIYRLTEKQYRQYIYTSEGPVYIGTLVGVSSFNATRATKDDYEDEGRRLRAADKKREAARKG